MTTDMTRADIIAATTTKIAFQTWIVERTFLLTEQYAELWHELNVKVAFALRHIGKFPELNTARNRMSWEKRKTNTKIQLFRLAFEIGLLIFSDKYVPFVLRRWRESQANT